MSGNRHRPAKDRLLLPRRSLAALGAAVLAGAKPGRAQGAGLRIGALTDPSVDPHFLYLSNNMAYSQHLFGALCLKDERSRPYPGLAESWMPVSDTEWEFTLRRGVKFHDGSDFTAADVAFSIERVTSLPNNPAPYTPNMRGINSTRIIDDHRIRVTTANPVPTLPFNLSNIYIVSHQAAKGATPADFRSGKAAIGTGPYRFVSYASGQTMEIARFDGYWGPKPAYERALFRFIPNDAARAAALLAGEVELIDFVPPELLARLGADPAIRAMSAPSDRVIFLVPDMFRDQTPFVRSRDGQALPANPLKDLRVRQALSLAINREALVRQVMDGLAAPIGQIVPPGYVGYSEDLKPDPYDPARARSLLAEAGYPNGFQLTIHGPNDRYTNDARTLQAAGAMLSRIGVETRVEAMPRTVYFPRASPPASSYSLGLLGWGSSGDGESGYGLSTLLSTFQTDMRMGANNYGRYSSPAVDAAVQAALREFDLERRRGLLQKAMRTAMEDYALIPLYLQYTTAAIRRTIDYTIRDDEKTLAMSARPA